MVTGLVESDSEREKGEEEKERKGIFWAAARMKASAIICLANAFFEPFCFTPI